MELNSKNIKKILFIILCGSVIFAAAQNFNGVAAFFSKIFSFISPVVAALCIAFVLNVLLTFLEEKVFKFMKTSKHRLVNRLQRPVCIILTYLITFGIIAVLILIIIPDIIDTVVYLFERLPSFVTDARDWLEKLLLKLNLSADNLPDLKLDFTAIANTFKNLFSGYSGKIVGDAVSITSSLFNGVFDAVFSVVISVYVLAQKEKIGGFVKRFISAFIPPKKADTIYYLANKTSLLFSKFISGQLTEAIILAILCYLGMLIFGFPNAAIISVLICVTALVPIVGATIGVVIGFLLILITNPIKALLFVVFFLVLQQIENNLIYPKVVGKAVGLPGVIVVSAVLIGGNMGGILASLIAVPTSAVIYTLVKEAMDKRNNAKTALKK